MIDSGVVMIYVSEMKRSLRFFIETLGMKLVEQAGDGWAVIDAGGGFRIALHATRADGPQPEHKGSMCIGLNVKGDFDETVAIYANRGIDFRVVKNPRVMMASFADPDGNPFYLSKPVTE
jgi:catechol 2,3-dioxygenase-like lactoylglutathione lyase family enzyme